MARKTSVRNYSQDSKCPDQQHGSPADYMRLCPNKSLAYKPKVDDEVEVACHPPIRGIVIELASTRRARVLVHPAPGEYHEAWYMFEELTLIERP